MREIEVRKWCDGCAAEIADSAGRVEPATHELRLTAKLDQGLMPQSGERLLDLCETHLKALWQPLAELLDEYGAKPDEAPSLPRTQQKRPVSLSSYAAGAPGPWLCLCGVERASSLEMVKHLRADHASKRITDLTGLFGMRCPLCGVDGKMLGPHITRAHPEQLNQSQAFVEADKLGDPHKVVAKQRRALGK